MNWSFPAINSPLYPMNGASPGQSFLDNKVQDSAKDKDVTNQLQYFSAWFFQRNVLLLHPL